MRNCLIWMLMALWPGLALAQDSITLGTITRAPFSMQIEGADTGFALELWQALATEIGLETELLRFDSFPEMMQAVQDGEIDAAIANISITAERERIIDFSQPIFDGGVQIMLQAGDSGGSSVVRAIWQPRFLLYLLIGFAGLIAIGMVMWLFERRRQDYFGPTAKDALFPAFWWALHLLVTQGYEEKMPQSRGGRLFGTLMVVASLFLVSIFVANITATMTLDALSENVEGIHDLDGRRVGTTEGSTTSAYLDNRGIGHRRFSGFDELIAAFEAGDLEAVVFDGPILAYYVQAEGADAARLVDRVFKRETYGIALPEGSALREPINRALLQVREDGTYDTLLSDWFGAVYGDG